jgi:hypothetical protein
MIAEEASVEPAKASLIREAYANGEGGYKTLAKRFDVSVSVIKRAVARAGLSKRAMGLCALPGVTAHARQRARERYDQDFSEEEWLKAWMSITEGRSVLVRRADEPNAGEVHSLSMVGADGPVDVLLHYDPGVGEGDNRLARGG